MLADFAAALRAAGLPVGTGDVLAYATAMSTLDPTDLTDLYWAGRTTLVTRRDSIAPYNQVFRHFFLNANSPVRDILTLRAQLTAETQAVLDVPATDPPPAGDDGQPEEATLGLMASDAEALRHKSFAACTPEELAMLRRIMGLDPAGPAAAVQHPADPLRACRARTSTCAGWCASRCGCTATRPS